MSQLNDDKDIEAYLTRVAEQVKPRLGGRNAEDLQRVAEENKRRLER